WQRASSVSDRRHRNVLLFFVEQAIWGMSVLARYVPTHYSQVNQYLSGVFYVASQIVDPSPWYTLYLGRDFSAVVRSIPPLAETSRRFGKTRRLLLRLPARLVRSHD